MIRSSCSSTSGWVKDEVLGSSQMDRPSEARTGPATGGSRLTWSAMTWSVVASTARAQAVPSIPGCTGV